MPLRPISQHLPYLLACIVACSSACGDETGGSTADTGPDSADTTDSGDADSSDAPNDTTDTGDATDTTAPDTASTARVQFSDNIDSIDPALSYFGLAWQYEYVTCAMLLNYSDRADTDTTTLVPEIASAMPEVSADGLRYTFKIADGFQLAPPSGEVVTARTVLKTFERAMAPSLESPGGFFMGDVVSIEVGGAAADELTFTLSQPAGDFPARVAMPFFCVIPSDTPHEPLSMPVPTAGPYYISSFTPVAFDPGTEEVSAPGEIVLEKNPNYRGSRPRKLERIVYRIGADEDATVEAVKNNEADYLPSMPPMPPEVRAALLAAYGPESASQRLFVYPSLGYRYITLNNSRGIFVDADVRRAVQHAIDRVTLGAVWDLVPNDNYLPPGVPGYGGEHLYPLDGPDGDMAEQLLAGRSFTAVLYIQDHPAVRSAADLLKAQLGAVGIDVTVEAIPQEDFYGRVATPDEPFDLAIAGWFADYPDPFNFLNVLLGKSFDYASSHFDDADFEAALQLAATLLGEERVAAYHQLNLDAMAASPMVVLGNGNNYHFFSERMGCVVNHPLYGINLGALCIE